MSRDKKKEGQLRSAASVLQSLLTNSKEPLSEQFLRWKVWASWEKIVGPAISKFSQPVAFREGKLWVQVDSSARLQEMRFFAADFIEKINKHIGQKWVRYIQFTLDARSVPARQEIEDDLRKLVHPAAETDPEL